MFLSAAARALCGVILAAVIVSLSACPQTQPRTDDDDSSAVPDDDDDQASDDDDQASDDDDSQPPEPTPCAGRFFIEVLVVDAFGGVVEDPLGVPPLGEAVVGAHQVVLQAPDYRASTVTYEVDEAAALGVAMADSSALLARSSDLRELSGFSGLCSVQTLYVGLDHLWFAGSGATPHRPGNDLSLMMNGEQFWAEVYADVSVASETVHWATWWWESDFELLRPANHAYLSQAQRWGTTTDALLVSLDGVTRRVLISELCGDACFGLGEWITFDDTLEEHGEEAFDDFEVLLQPNPTSVPFFDPYKPEPITVDFLARVSAQPRFAGRSFSGDEERGIELPAATYHQKLITVDGEVAFVAGFNTKGTDWDSDGHLLFDERRMQFDADLGDRLDVIEKQELPDFEPRRDYAIRMEGPLVADVESIFAQRWSQAIYDEETFWQQASHWTPPEPVAPIAGGVEAQLVLTMPEPFADRSILETLIKAIEQAEDYIFIEDQYWRAPLLNQVLLETLLLKPALQLVVITMPVSSYDGGAYWTVETDQIFRSYVPDQYRTFTLRSFAWAWDVGIIYDSVEAYSEEVFLHSKLLIVDDRYLSVGSANKNNRGFLYEGEANVSVLDDAWVGAARQRVFDNLLGSYWAPLQTGDVVTDLELFDLAAQDNELVINWWLDAAWDMEDEAEALYWDQLYYTSGFLFPLDLGTSWLIAVGPDAF